MTELSGTLEGVGLPAIVRFLAGLNKTGCLGITHNDVRGEIFFEAGQVIGASLGSRHGLAALDAVCAALGGGNFAFESGEPTGAGERIELSRGELLAHLEELASRSEDGTQRLPTLDAVACVVQHQDERGEEPLPLDRGTLQTLLAIDGQRPVREVVARRGTFDALWQLSNLRELGLITLTDAAHSVNHLSEPVAAPLASSAVSAALDEAANHCPKLGFEDDPRNSFSRPTRLHRCFAQDAPLPLSLDQQRELCLSAEFGTCPRLNLPGITVPPSARPGAQPLPHEPQSDDPRIVRLPFVARANGQARSAEADHTAVGIAAARLRPAGAPTGSENGARRTPLRARMERPPFSVAGTPSAMANATSTAPPPAAPRVVVPAEPSTPFVPLAPPRSHSGAGAAEATPRAVGPAETERAASSRTDVPIRAAIGGVLLLVVVGVVGYLLWSQFGGGFGDDSVDPNSMPNSAAVLRGTPIAAVVQPQPAAAVRATAVPPAATPVAPAALGAPAAAPDTVAAPTTAAASGRTILDETFGPNVAAWPSSADGPAQLTSGAYRLTTRQAGQFVAIGAPIAEMAQDVTVNATFRKLTGPAGGGYGLILRDQATSPQTGTNQNGRYYVFEVGDKGEIGIWRRDVDHWVDLLPWQHSDAVKPGTATNDLTARATGNTLTLSVNGVQVDTRTDGTYPAGNVGIFVGGDSNVVSVDHFSVTTP